MSLYDDLGVAKDATPDQIKRAYRSKASKSHPDKGGTSEEFNRVHKAYETLIDPSRRGSSLRAVVQPIRPIHERGVARVRFRRSWFGRLVLQARFNLMRRSAWPNSEGEYYFQYYGMSDWRDVRADNRREVKEVHQYLLLEVPEKLTRGEKS